MIRSKPLLAALSLSAAAVLLGAAKPAPQPTAFTPAISYRYGYTELRLANADGSAAALLLRLPPPSGQIGSILQHAIAPLGQRQVAFVDASVFGVKSLRIVSWTQPTPGGPLSVSLDPTPMFSLAAPYGEITSLDFSPDGTRLAAVSWIDGQNHELRFFDVASRTQIGDAIPLAQDGSILRWRASDDSLLMLGAAGVSTFKDGVQAPLFTGIDGGFFDTFNAGSAEAVFLKHCCGGNFLQRWDGVTISDGQALLTTVTDGVDPSIACDNARMIYRRLSPRSMFVIRTLATGAEQEFSRDRSISYANYPGAC